MNKTVILSSNDNIDYLKYYPYVAWAWNQLGWDTLLFYHGKHTALLEEFKACNGKFDTERNKIQVVGNIEGYRPETIVQVSRLFGGMCFPSNEERVLMIGDADMIPLSDYWHPESDKITTYGWDLTDFGHFPMCYIAAPVKIWRQLMEIDSVYVSIEHEIKKLLDKTPKAKSEIFEEWWQVDQDIITEIIKNHPEGRKDIMRGVYAGLASYRADRYDWERTKDYGTIDAHMPRPFSLDETKYILQKSFNKLPDWV